MCLFYELFTHHCESEFSAAAEDSDEQKSNDRGQTQLLQLPAQAETDSANDGMR